MKKISPYITTGIILCFLNACSHSVTIDPGPVLMGVDVPLRIMPLGDSITEGLCDTNDNCKVPSIWLIPTMGDGVEACSWAANSYNPEAVGYRAFLRDMIISKGLDMVYVGSVEVVEGLAHEGHSGWKIQDLDYCIQNGDWLENALPNVILLHIGTNDAAERRKPEDMANDLQNLLEHIYAKVPDTTEVIVAQIIPARQGWMNDIIIPYNELVGVVVEMMISEGKHVSIVEMTGVIQSETDLDGFGHHPNVIASERMARVWFAKILELIGQMP